MEVGFHVFHTIVNTIADGYFRNVISKDLIYV